jgi:hypothetical protein
MASVKGLCIIDLEAGEGGIKHSPARDNDDVQASRNLMTPEDLSREPLGSIPLNRGTKFPTRRDTEPRNGPAIRNHEQRHVARRYSNA